MIDNEPFSAWLKNNTQYSEAVITDTVSRMKRADSMLSFADRDTETYLFYLEKTEAFRNLSVSVRSQIRKSVKLYIAYRTAL